MRYGERKNDGAACWVNNCNAVPKHMQKDIREISKVYTQPHARGQGHATELLRGVCKEADSKKMILIIAVEPYGSDPPMTEEQLVEWYCTTFDFNILQQEPLMLVRMFNPFPDMALTQKVGQIITESRK